jgi:hypothetical protein
MADIRINALATTAASTASDDFVAVDGSANGTRKLNAFSPTFGGNLTVSGTGTSSVAGVFKAGTDIVTGDTSAFQVHNNVDDKPMVGFYRGGTLRSVLRLNTDNDFRLLSSDLSTLANLIVGNLLIGGTTDSGNGNLQLKDTSGSSTKGIGFGTDTSWYRSAGGVLTLDTSAGFQGFEARRNGTVNLNFYSNSSDAFIGYKGTGSLTIQTLTGSPALTLDSSQNATFAGKVGIGVSPASWELNLQQSAVNSAVRIISPTALGLNDSSIYISWASGSKALIAASYESTGSYRPLVLSAGGVDSLTLDTSGNSTFAGNIKTAAPSGGTAATWRLGTVASVSPTSPNRTIEVEIGGTTYYIHAKTTNN